MEYFESVCAAEMFRRNELFHMPNVYSYFDQSFIILNRVHDFYIDYIAQMVYIYKKEKKKWSIENMSVGQGRYHFCALWVRIFNTGILYIETRRAPTYRRNSTDTIYIYMRKTFQQMTTTTRNKCGRCYIETSISKLLEKQFSFQLISNYCYWITFEQIRGDKKKRASGSTHGHFCMASHIVLFVGR